MEKVVENLGHSERTAFNRVLKCYEQKEFKKGLKLCKSILSKPHSKDHPETMALQGVFTACIGNHDEGYMLCKKALVKNLKSFMSWHILGVIEKERRNYSSSLSCFVTANKLNANNLQILKDKALLEFHCNELSAHLETRKLLYTIGHKSTQACFGMAYAYYLLQQFSQSLEVLQNMRVTYGTNISRYLTPNEINYLTIFEVNLLMKMGKYLRALDHMDAHMVTSFDIVKMTEFQAECHYQLKNKSESLYASMKLIMLNPNCDEYYDLAIRLLNRADVILQFLENLYESLSDSFYLKYLLLKYSRGEKFAEYAKKFIRLWLNAKPPGAMKFVWSVVKDSEEKQAIVTDLLTCLNPEFSSYFLTASFHLCAKKYDLALKYAIECYKLKPENTDGLILLSSCYRRVGNFNVARSLATRAANLSIGDRYTNSVAGNLSFYLNDIKVADDLLKRFTRVDQNINDYMKDIQCIWYRLEKMKHYLRNNKLFLALHHMKIALSFHSQFMFDKLDYYHYCVRQMFLLSHENLLNMDAHIMNTDLYLKTYVCCIKIFTALYKHLEERESEVLNNRGIKNQDMSMKTPETDKTVKCCSDCGTVSKINCAMKLKEIYSADNWKCILLGEMMLLCGKLAEHRSDSLKTHKVAANALLLGGNFNKGYTSLKIVMSKCDVISSAIVEASFLRNALKNVESLKKENVDDLSAHIGHKDFIDESVRNYVKGKSFEDGTPLILTTLIRFLMNQELQFDTTHDETELLDLLRGDCQMEIQHVTMILKKASLNNKSVNQALTEYLKKWYPDTVIKFDEFTTKYCSNVMVEN